MEFFKQYTIKGESSPIDTEEAFLKLRNGVCIIKNTGEEYIKQEDHVFNKSNRQLYSKDEVDNNFANLSKQNTFTDKQFSTAEITESNQLTTKQYVDKTVNDAKVDTSNFADIHKSNVFDEIQTCAEKPSSREHLANKAYVDDSIDNIVFDTSNFANINKSNTFPEPQTCLADPLNQYHLTNKKYVDKVVAQVNGDTSSFVRYNTKNHFEDDQTFNYRLILNHEPTEKNDAVTLNYLNKKVEDLNLSQYASLSESNTFTKDQHFSGYVYCNNRPLFDNQLANKKYVDESLGNISVSGAVAYTNKDNQFSVQQTFLAPVVVQNPVSDNNPTTKQYVDSKIQDSSISYANLEVQGTVKLSYGLDDIQTDVQRVTTESQVKNVRDDLINRINNLSDETFKLSGSNSISANNTFLGVNVFEDLIDGVSNSTLSFYKEIDDSNTIESRWYYNSDSDFGFEHSQVTSSEHSDTETSLGTTKLISSANIGEQSVKYATNAGTATKADNADNLAGHPVSDFVRSVNGINADANGNVEIKAVGSIGAITGEIKWFAFNNAPDCFLVCNGANVSRETYADLFAVIGTTYGAGDGSTTFALPNLIDKFAQGSTTVGTYKSAGLPNITGTYRPIHNVEYDYASYSGCFAGSSYISSGHGGGGNYQAINLNFNAAYSSSIYGKSTTVQPPALTLLPCIKY